MLDLRHIYPCNLVIESDQAPYLQDSCDVQYIMLQDLAGDQLNKY